MAEDKKGFILYADQKELFEQLPNEKAGELIKHIFKYVNDENPTTDDLIINLAFTPIKQQLKRDLKKFEASRKQRSDAGKRSAKLRKEQREATDSTSVERTSTKSTVTDNVTVKVNDTVNVNDNDEERNLTRKIDDIANDYEKNERLIEAVLSNGQNLAENKKELILKLWDFVRHLKSIDENVKKEKDFKSHFLNWMKKKKEKSSEQKEKPKTRLDAFIGNKI